MAAAAEVSSGASEDRIATPSAAAEVPALTMGSLFNERFELLRPLGHGHFGYVFMAQDTQNSHRQVAIKILKPQFLDTPEVLRRFNQEGASLELLTHPNIVRIYERGEWKGMHYIITEYIEGESLEDWLQRCRSSQLRPSWQIVIQIFRQLCEAIAFAHNLSTVNGIIHRDLKPANIMLTARDRGPHVIVLDFGLARLGERNETQSAEAMGTPGYMAPEQIGSQAEVGPWTDVYALGVILLEMLTLKNRTEDEKSFWISAMYDPKGLLRQMHKRCPNVPVQVLQAILVSITSRVQYRYENARIFINAIDKAQRSAQMRTWAEHGARYLILATIALTNISCVQPRLVSAYLFLYSLNTSKIKDYLQRFASTDSLYFNISNGKTHSEIKLLQIPQQAHYVSVNLRHGKEIYSEDLMVSELRSFERREIHIESLMPNEVVNMQVIIFGKKHHLAEGSKPDPLIFGQNQQIPIRECLDGVCRQGLEAPGTDNVRHYNGIWCDRYNVFIGGSNLKIRGHNSLSRFAWNISSESPHYILQLFGNSIHDLYAIGGCNLERKNCPYPSGTNRNKLLKWDPIRKTWDPQTIPEISGQLWYAYPLKDGGLWIVGTTAAEQGMIVYRDAQGHWQPPITLNLFGSRLADIWQANPNSIWAVGSEQDKRGVLLHADRTFNFSPLDVPPAQHALNAIWGTSDQNFWLGTTDGRLFHHEGQSFAQASCAPLMKDIKINVLLGHRDDDIWAIGSKGFLANYDGRCWNRLPIPYPATRDEGPTSLNGMFLSADSNSVCVVGGSGDVFQYRYAAPNPRPTILEQDWE